MTLTMKTTCLITILLLPLLPSFALAGGVPDGKELTTCPEPRPQACTRDYRPVCAQLSNDTFKTYPNGCTACTDTAVTGYRSEACEDSLVVGESTVCTEPRPQICTMDYRPVCAQLSDGTFKTYSNGCTACTDPAVTGHREGACGE